MAYQAQEARYGAMRYRHCGKSGLQLPEVSLGTWHNFGTRDDWHTMREMCRTAFDLGITHFDLADNYGPEPGSAEENVGRILRSDFSPYRDELVITTKAGHAMWNGPYGDWGSRKHLLSGLDASLKRMGLSYVDIFYHHRMDPNTPLEESMGALAQAVKSGKALYAGLSKYDPEIARRATAILNELHCPYVVEQVRYSIFDRHIEPEGLMDTAEACGFGLVTFSPLAQGLLTDRYLNGIPKDSRAGRGIVFLTEETVATQLPKIRALNDLAHERGQTLSQMALCWVLRNPVVTSVLIGASSPAQIRENVAAVTGGAPFSAEELARIDAICAD